MNYLPASEIRSKFAAAMSDMYRREVPMYGTLVDMVQQINRQELDRRPELRQSLDESHGLNRLSAERHGAIRLGKAEELFTMRRLFAVMGMFPVSYYDLTAAGIPVHSTAFRPLEQDQLNDNPFRIFTSLLRLDLVEDEELRQQASLLLSERKIFTHRALELIQSFEQQYGLTQQQADEFITEALQTFRWHHLASVDMHTYQRFLDTHSLLADIVCFKGPHINHLTPRTLNIDHAQQLMVEHGMDPKAIIEGPPRRQHPILLRQTSFKALNERVEFLDEDSTTQPGTHSARFGEIEQRGMALTPNGRALYDSLLNEVRQHCPNPALDPDNYYRQLDDVFKQFPDDLRQIQQQGLGYFYYSPTAHKTEKIPGTLDALIDENILNITPITYEDFLPVSAAGIFESNLGNRETQQFTRSPNQKVFETQLGCAVINEFEYYAEMQRESLQDALQSLGMDQTLLTQILQKVSQ
jgi:uncharacterized glyoxalase superfamily metalloenzyme YdcJ